MSGRVLVAMSGGVDSSVAAALLKEAGCEVIGATMQVWPQGDEPAAGLRSCCSLEAVEDARRVAARLGIRHYLLNFREEFRQRVITPFIHSYLSGQTPNPCILCNKEIKFEALLRKALALECECVATGHYARLKFEEGRWQIYAARDLTKDQSYVLYSLSQEQLAHALFPLGERTKSEIRSLAAALDLPVADKPDSQQICFIPEGDTSAYLARSVPESRRPGAILSLHGEKIGDHPGIAFYTVGQRRGLRLACKEPQYVSSIDPAENTIVVASEEGLYRRRVYVGKMNFVGLGGLQESKRLAGKLRYTMAPQPCLAEPFEEGVAATFEQPQRAPAPGQAAVFYDGERIAFGGVIESAE